MIISFIDRPPLNVLQDKHRTDAACGYGGRTATTPSIHNPEPGNWDLRTVAGISELEFLDLYCGEWDRIDRMHAAHLEGMPNVTVQTVPACFHLCIPGLASAGCFWPSVAHRLDPNCAGTALPWTVE
jgi:hypothetical protein